MSYDFNAEEIFEMAEQIERNGAKFYRTAAESISDPESKDFLLKLAEMEDKHERTFNALKAEMAGQGRESTVFDPSGEAVLYLRALADTRVFFEKEMDLSSIRAILKEALTAEKDSIVFYLGMQDMVPERLGKNKIDLIIKEEMAHIRLLSNKLKDLK
jgi:rubrerythrin